jgi:hypothetical protein
MLTAEEVGEMVTPHAAQQSTEASERRGVKKRGWRGAPGKGEKLHVVKSGDGLQKGKLIAAFVVLTSVLSFGILFVLRSLRHSDSFE